MIVLDTNVVSELMRKRPDPSVEKWIAATARSELAITSITVAELLYGIRLLPDGRRRRGLEEGWLALAARGFGGIVLPFDAEAADIYSRIVVDRRKLGRPINAFDAMIAGIAVSRSADIATRDTADFEGCGAGLIDPWGDSASLV